MQNALRREDSAGYMTNLAARLFARAIDQRLKMIGVSSGQLPVFFALGDGGALSQKALVEIAEIEQPTMAATLARMERDGLISRSPDPEDRRSSLISLTPLALTKAAAVREAIGAVNKSALGGISDVDRADYLRLLGLVVKALQTTLAPARHGRGNE